MTITLIRDIETRSTVDISDVGPTIYAKHPSTEVLCVGYCVDGEPVKLWHPGEPTPPIFRIAAKDLDFRAVAHNAGFEMAIERYILGPKFHFGVVPLERNICTMAIANALALPAKLERLTKILNLENRKDVVGSRIMQQMSKPRRARKGEDETKILWYEDAERREKLDQYCVADVEATKEVVELLPWLSPQEHLIWQLDQRINEHGLYIDVELAQAAQQIIDAAEAFINREIIKLTNGQVSTINELAKLKDWLVQYCNVSVTELDKGAIENLLDQDLPAPARRAIELRFLGAQAATKKVRALLDRVDTDHRIRHAFVYHAAGPGRWASRGVQVHNLKRSMTEDIESAVEIIGRGDFNVARKHYDNPLSVIGDSIRAMICAAPGNVLIGGDFSGIEARVTAWIADEHSKLAVFRDYDADKGPDPYIVAAAKIYGVNADKLAADFATGIPEAREQRQAGKAAELAFGFGGGLNAFRRFSPTGGGTTTDPQSNWDKRHGRGPSGGEASAPLKGYFSDVEVHRIKNAWRRAHPNIVQFWDHVYQGAWKAIKNPLREFPYKRLKFVYDEAFLFITLPSGRRLSYPHARIVRSFFATKEDGSGGHVVVVDDDKKHIPYGIVFKDNASGMWRDVRPYPGFFTENIVQAIARDLLAEAMIRIDAIGLSIAAHVHDEIILEVSNKEVEQLFLKLMLAVPPWAEGMPIMVKTWTHKRYVK